LVIDAGAQSSADLEYDADSTLAAVLLEHTMIGVPFHVIDVPTKAVLWKYPGRSACRSFGPKDELFVLSEEGNFTIHEARTGALRSTTQVREQRGPCAISRDGRLMAVAPLGVSGHITIVNAATGKPLREVERPSTQVFALAFSPDSRWLASGEFNRVARLWEVGTGVEQEIFGGHAAWVGALQFSQDSRCLVTSSYGALKVWHATAGRLLETLPVDPEAGTGPLRVNYSRDGTISMLTLAPDGKSWTPAQLRYACPEPRQPPDAPALRVLAIGVGEYRDTRRNLFGARKDAAEIARLLGQSGEALYRHVTPIKVFDRVATRSGIEAAFGRLAAEASPNDVAVVFFAGHGIDTGNEFYLLPHDVGESNAPEVLQRTAISGAALASMLQKVRARRKLFIVDACQSGGALTRLASTFSTAAGDSVHLLGASLDSAIEIRDLGQGVMTYAIVEALRGKASTVFQLFEAVKMLVPQIRSTGRPQFVIPVTSGSDFPLVAKP
jgi:hypothetical protein